MSSTQEYLVIVESPAKIKSIGKYLGPSYRVMASFGHVRDLPPKDLAVDTENHFAPSYVITKHKVVKELKDVAKKMKRIYIATDPDREGHGIAWHLCEVLNITYPKARRMVFHEITQSAVKAALSKADQYGEMNMAEVESYQARRVVDRLVGYKVSPQLWKNVRGAGSAGRVQSVATRMVVDKEEEIRKHIPKEKYVITGTFKLKKSDDKKELIEAKLEQIPKQHSDALNVLDLCKDANFQVGEVKSVIVFHSPPLPFKTSVYQQEAGKRFGMSPKQSMSVAQKLYESGKITYHRTDTTSLSDTFKSAAKEYISKTYGNEYMSDVLRKFSPKEEKEQDTNDNKKKKKGEQAAHEAIRPTNINEANLTGNFTPLEQKIYRMIWVRAVASLMEKEKCRRYSATIVLDNSDKYWFLATHLVTLFPGFKILTKVDTPEEEDVKNKIVPNLEVNQPLDYLKIESKQTFSEPPKRYTEASLVKDLENKGVGRPSTYASIINTIQSRAYVAKKKSETVKKSCLQDTLVATNNKIVSKSINVTFGDNKQRLFPTGLGEKVNTFLCSNLNYMMEYNFTSDLETKLDEIADGKYQWDTVVGDVYGKLMKLIGAVPSPQPMSKEQKEKAMQQKNDRVLGIHEGKSIEFFIGRYGPFVKYNGQSYSLPKDKTEIDSVTMQDAIALINARKPLASYTCDLGGKQGELTIKKGPYGYYMQFQVGKAKAQNLSFPFGSELRENEAAVKALTEDECVEHALNAFSKPKKAFTKNKK